MGTNRWRLEATVVCPHLVSCGQFAAVLWSDRVKFWGALDVDLGYQTAVGFRGDGTTRGPLKYTGRPPLLRLYARKRLTQHSIVVFLFLNMFTRGVIHIYITGLGLFRDRSTSRLNRRYSNVRRYWIQRQRSLVRTRSE